MTLDAIADLLDKKLNPIQNELRSFQRKVGEDINSLKKSNEKLHSELKNAKAKTEKMQQYSRRNNVVFNGIPFFKDESPMDTAMKISTAFDLSLNENDIDCCHRLFSKNNPTSDDQRDPAFLIRFVHRHKKVTVMKKIKLLKPTAEVLGGSKEIKIYCGDHLTKQSLQLKKNVQMLLQNTEYTVTTFDCIVHICRKLK